ncbi:MAG: DUF4194 domain-containing protein [Nitrospirota bacterium]
MVNKNTHASDNEPQTAELYHGDTGRLPQDGRSVLAALLAGPSIDAKRNINLWPALLRYEDEIRSRLSELYLTLELDRELGVAFIKKADTGDLDTPTTLRRREITFIQSVLILYLRRLLIEATSKGEPAITSETDMMDHLKLYEPTGNTDHHGFEKKINSAVDTMRKFSILSAIRGSDDRYEISPTLKLLFTPENAESMIRVYRALKDGQVPDNKSVDDGEGEDE